MIGVEVGDVRVGDGQPGLISGLLARHGHLPHRISSPQFPRRVKVIAGMHVCRESIVRRQIEGTRHQPRRLWETRTGRMRQGQPLWSRPTYAMTPIDMNSGEHVWTLPTGDGDRIRANPAPVPLDLPLVGGDAGFAAGGHQDGSHFYPLNVGGVNNGPRLVASVNATGEEIASADLPGPTIGTRMMYMLEGRHYVE
jgi:hypothetical protein